MKYYPINVNCQDQEVVVIGGGGVAFRKIQGLLRAGAKVRAIDPKPGRKVAWLAAKKKIALAKRPYRRGDLGRSLLAVAATDDEKVHLKIRDEASRKKILLNVADRPGLCDFVFPARLNRGEFVVTVSTGGASPALAKKVRQDLEGIFGPEYGILTGLLKRVRMGMTGEELKRSAGAFSRFVRSSILTRLKNKDWKGVESLLRKHFGKGGFK